MARCCRKKRRFDEMDGSQRQGQGSLKVLAAQTLKIASINGLGDTEKLETELEDEIRWEESRHPPSEIIGRARRRCEEILHAKLVLLFIVLLNVIDCLLVIGELTLDFHHISKRVLARTAHIEEFLEKMQGRYPPFLGDLEGVEEDDLTRLFNRFLHSFVFWNASGYSDVSLAADCMAFISSNSSLASSFPAVSNITTAVTPSPNITNITSNSSSNINVFLSLLELGSAPLEYMAPIDRKAYDVVGISHALHYASLSILSFLLAETILKILCVGRRFFKKRMEVFDAVIIAVSFTLDVVFVEGLNNLHLQHYVVVLSFLLPWRVLRVLNSLIVAVMIQHRFHLKLLYKQKRKINKQLTESSDHVKSLEKQVELLKGLCSTNGIPDWQINKTVGQALPSSSQGGLKALSKLVFHAAESFAPRMSSSHTNLNNNHPRPSSSSSPLSLSTPSITIQCNGDLEQGPSNGNLGVLHQESHVEIETPLASQHASPSKDSGLDESRAREDFEVDSSEVSASAEGEEVNAGDKPHTEDRKEEEGGSKEREVDGKEGRRTEEEGAEEGEKGKSRMLTFYLPADSVDHVDACASPLHEASTRM